MMQMSELAQSVHGRIQGGDALFSSVSTDTRSIQPGALFVALSGPNFDGNAFVSRAAEKGAVGALVREDAANAPLPTVAVDDTRAALGSLAATWRGKQQAKIYAVTGSNGKTTVKEMLASILALEETGIATAGNLNNDIGMPLTLLRLRQGDVYAVLEMGMNHAGEIARLTDIARPDVALINNAAAAHLEGLGSLENVARAKGEILQGLGADGIAVLNADDAFFPLWKELAGARRIISFGLADAADVSVSIASSQSRALAGERMRMRTPRGEVDIRLPLPGQHNVMNALAAAAAALAGGASLEQIRQGLENMQPVAGRLVVLTGVNGATILDDSYNANPASVAAALDVLAGYPGEKILVMGDMGELGEDSLEQHEQIGVLAKSKGVDRLLAVGEQSRLAVEAFGGGGRWFEDQTILLAALQPRLNNDTAVLVKGSRASRMDRISQKLIGE
ncbi:MAG: UDP-N-acetylmuramoyl-tripeptide--D-alanyl-D-alanine ligase [Gammaproteobacteria bacterium]|nr:MAG: UDP-N-acetylmuramoyl-tripeptide--D-alanyl-D-alanine ligase [Gammaproteobacteria bacterium]